MANLPIGPKFALRSRIRLKFGLVERNQNGVKTKTKMVKLLRKKIVSTSIINDDAKPPYACHLSEYLITMVINVNTYVWTVICVRLQSVTR